MQVCATASARETIGGPSLDSRTPWRKASFQRRRTFPFLVRENRGRNGLRSTRPPAPAVRRKSRREIVSRIASSPSSAEILLVVRLRFWCEGRCRKRQRAHSLVPGVSRGDRRLL